MPETHTLKCKSESFLASLAKAQAGQVTLPERRSKLSDKRLIQLENRAGES